jgi:sugar lactone lactonase YvrE
MRSWKIPKLVPPQRSRRPHLASVRPAAAIAGGRITLHGTDFPIDGPCLPEVTVGEQRGRVTFASPTSLTVVVPPDTGGGPRPVAVEGASSDRVEVEIAAPFAAGLHQVDNPVFDTRGNLYVTYSGTRGQQVPVSIFRVRPDGTRESFSTGIVNPTSMALDASGRLHVSSRFEGIVYRLGDDGTAEPFATELGVACGLAFAPDGTLFVGDRSGTVFKVDGGGHAQAFASLPPSVAAFHLALGHDGLYVAAPTLSSYDVVYRLDASGGVTVHNHSFGRPQGLAFDDHTLFVVEALAGASGLYRCREGREPELVLAGDGLVGVAFDGQGGVVVCSNDTAYRGRLPH